VYLIGTLIHSLIDHKPLVVEETQKQ